METQTVKPKKEIKPVVAFWIKLPPDLRNAFKAHCAKRGRTMTQSIIRFMKKTIEEAKV